MNGNDAIAFSIRRAAPGDEGSIVALLAEFAAFEKAPVFHLTEALVARDLTGSGAVARCELLYVQETVAGLAVWFPTYRSFRAARGLFVEDIYVTPDFRGRGLGTALLAHLARLAQTETDGFLEWLVLDWNSSAIAFYQALGARPATPWQSYRLEGAALQRLAS